MKEKLLVKNREIVTPGEILAEGMSYLPSGKSAREDEKIFATSLGLVNVKGRVIKVIPLAGRYVPRRGDSVVGKITAISKFGWRVDIKSPFDAELNVAEASNRYIDTKRVSLDKFFALGDHLLAGIIEISESGYIKLSARNRPYRRLGGGIVVNVSPSKIPRIIGKQGSMIRTLKDESKCEIIVGQNGWVWIKGEPEKEMKAIQAIKIIEKESHKSGLTDKVKKMLRGKS